MHCTHTLTAQTQNSMWRSTGTTHAYTSLYTYTFLNSILNLCIYAVSHFPTHAHFVLPLPRKPRACSDFMFELSRCYSSLPAFCVSVLRYVHCAAVPQWCHSTAETSWMYTVHGLHCYKQNDNYTDSWMKISYIYWNDDHTVFGRIISGMKFRPFLVCPV